MRSALESLLAVEPGLTVVGSVGDADAAGAAVRRLHPDVVVSDLSLVTLNGGLLDRWGPVPAGLPVVVASFEAPAAIEARLRARGAAAYVSKEHFADRLPDVLRELRAASPTVPAPA